MEPVAILSWAHSVTWVIVLALKMTIFFLDRKLWLKI